MQNFPQLDEKTPPHLTKPQIRKSKFTNIAKSLCGKCHSTFGNNVRHFNHKYNIASVKWAEPFTD